MDIHIRIELKLFFLKKALEAYEFHFFKIDKKNDGLYKKKTRNIYKKNYSNRYIL